MNLQSHKVQLSFLLDRFYLNHLGNSLKQEKNYDFKLLIIIEKIHSKSNQKYRL